VSDIERDFHETWLGMVQPTEGLVVSVPVLVNAQCIESHSPKLQRDLLALCAPAGKDESASVRDLPLLLAELLGLTPDLWDAAPGYRADVSWEGTLHEDVSHYAPEGPQTVAPTLGLRKQGSGETGYELLLWEVPLELPLDKPEAQTGDWEYPPSAKFERLLRAVRVPVGLLTNGRSLRLLYAPHGEASGHIDFRLDDMLTVGGRPILDALVMLLHAQRFFSVTAERSLPALLAESRKYQANVTNELGEQVLEALALLLRGFAAAAERDGQDKLEQALARENDHLYKGLLTVLLRMVFVLYAEDRGLLPVEHKLYEQHYSLFALFKQLQDDHGQNPDSMSRRYGAWGRLVALFRALFLGVRAGDFFMPARRGALFDPNSFAFLEGWDPAGSSPISEPILRAAVEVPTIEDETIFLVLQKLIVLDGQRISYRTLEVEQIGSVYERMMGYHVLRVPGAAVRMRPDGVWLSAEELLAVAPAQRASWLAETVNLPKAQAAKLAESLKGKRAEAAFDVLSDYAIGRSKSERAGNVARDRQLVLQPGLERRRTSSHYTPRSLSSKVVARTLEPLLKCMTKDGAAGPSSERILMLRVCDPAVGSGAFLVEACRVLADELVAAWTREGVVKKYADPVMYARRRVAQCCLYGVDKNAAAVELAKLSLWLVTLAKDRPFTFLDSNIRHGDSLVGLSLEQIRAFHWKPQKQVELFSTVIDEALKEAIEGRDKLRELALRENGTSVDPREKEIAHRDAEDALERVKLIADVCVGAFFGNASDKEREKERLRRLEIVQRWWAERNGKAAATEGELREMRRELRERQVPFHWPLEFADVFWDERPDPLAGGEVNGAAFMDSFVGNPPFMGVVMIAEQMGDAYVPWLRALHDGTVNKFDLSAHFFRRAAILLGRNGTMGLIATNTIGQGDTRETGLQRLLDDGLYIYDAFRNLHWPGQAAVTVSIVHLVKGLSRARPSPRLDGSPCVSISSQLAANDERADPLRLASSESCSFNGSYVLGMGFMVAQDERDALAASCRKNITRILPYIGGEEVNTHPQQRFGRHVINFGAMPLDEASAWPDLISIVRQRVKPERDKQRDTPDGKRFKERWWQFGRSRPELYAAIARLPRCLVNSQVSKHLVFAFQPVNQVFGHTLYVYPLPVSTAFAVLQSRIHEPWARLLSSTMEDRLRYAASDCFETFPFPQPDPRSVIPELERIGELLYSARAKYMLDTQQGLTKTYNALKDPACTEARILSLRKLHEHMDAAVLRAYGWSDLTVPPFCALRDADRQAQEAFKSAVIDRLFALNAERASEESLLGLGKVKQVAKAAAKTKGTVRATRPPVSETRRKRA
jgi:hypothetical protein